MGDAHDRRPLRCEGRVRRRAGDAAPFRDGAGEQAGAEPTVGFDPVPLEFHVVREGVCWSVTLDATTCLVEGEPFTPQWWSNAIFTANFFIDAAVEDGT